MKKTILALASTIILYAATSAQDAYVQQMKQQVAKLDNANSVKDYQQLASNFMRIADAKKNDWLPYYYAAFCNAKTGWLQQDDPENIEPFANQAEQQIKKALSLLDTARQKNELSDVYCVVSMVNRAKVFINPSAYGRQYGPASHNYILLAERANPANPRALYLEGWEKFTTPKMWGGDKNKAKELLQAANQKFNSTATTGIEPHWGKKEVQELLKQF